MLKTLYGKLALVLGVLLVAIGLLYVVISHSLSQHYAQKANQQFNRDLAHNLVADRELVVEGRIDRRAVEATFMMYMKINPSIEIYLLDLEGTILAYSAEPAVVKRRRVSLAPIRAFLGGNPRFPLLGDDPRNHDQQKSFSVTPVPSAQNPEGYLYVVLRGETYESIERLYSDSLLLRLSGWTLVGSLLFGLLSGLVIFALLTRRLRRLAHLLDGFCTSHFRKHHPYGGRGLNGDEIDRLGADFDQMAQRMEALLAKLEKRDALRRELVNNVSHDLRTPLTCLHGYLETLLLKDRQLNNAERYEYLGMALKHSERLGQLVGELFELAKLEANTVKPDLEPFHIAELIQDIAQKYRLSCAQQKIFLRVQLAEELPFVRADIGQIERVMENLIANAVRHTPPQGRITIRLERHRNRVTVSVTNTGDGIAPADLPHVFERYRQGRETQNDSRHAGLGLAIAKEIVALHGSKLKVISRLHRGACFAFQLPVLEVGARLSAV